MIHPLSNWVLWGEDVLLASVILANFFVGHIGRKQVRELKKFLNNTIQQCQMDYVQTLDELTGHICPFCAAASGRMNVEVTLNGITARDFRADEEQDGQHRVYSDSKLPNQVPCMAKTIRDAARDATKRFLAEASKTDEPTRPTHESS